VIASGSFLFAMSAGASTSASPANFTQFQLKLEQQLTFRVTQLQVLSTDVTKATSLPRVTRARLPPDLRQLPRTSPAFLHR
jgi:hypothetical protein